MEQPQTLPNRWLYYILSLFFPPILGIILFFMLRTRPESDAPQVARNSLIIGLAMFAVLCVLIVGCVLLALLVAAAD